MDKTPLPTRFRMHIAARPDNAMLCDVLTQVPRAKASMSKRERRTSHGAAQDFPNCSAAGGQLPGSTRSQNAAHVRIALLVVQRRITIIQSSWL